LSKANAYRNGVEYNKIQAQKQQEVQRLQGQLAEQQKNLEKMQETARKQALQRGLGSIGSNGFRGCRSGTPRPRCVDLLRVHFRNMSH